MIISKKNNYIFLAVPKTGTTSIQKFLLENDSSAKKNYININGKDYRFKEHYTALEIKQILGDHYDEFMVFGFIRHPYSRLVSGYYFYKNKVQQNNMKKSPVRKYIRIYFAKLLPFKLWVLLYPYKSNIEYFIDEENNQIVDRIGIFEYLDSDFNSIINDLNIKNNRSKLSHINKSKHNHYLSYFKSTNFRNLINFKIKKDLFFYESIINKKI